MSSDQRALLIGMVKDIAQVEKMNFADGSAEIDAVALHQREVTGIAEVRRGPIISLTVHDAQTGSASFSNGGYVDQMFVGFGARADREKAKAFAGRVLQQLSTQWDIQRVDGETGMQPLTCPAMAKAPSQGS